MSRTEQDAPGLEHRPPLPTALDVGADRGPPGGAQAVSAESYRIVGSILKYTSLLFAFPAAALVNYAGIAVEPHAYWVAAPVLFILFIFLIAEVATSQAWLMVEFFRPSHPSGDAARAFRVAAIDVVRVFFLMAFYICYLRAVGIQNNRMTNFASMSLLFFGGFLLSNYIWNRIVTPEHKNVFDRYMTTFDHNRDGDHFLARAVSTVYTIQILLFAKIFPIFAFVIIAVAILEPILEFISPTIATLTLIALGIALLIQTLAKSAQGWIFYRCARSFLQAQGPPSNGTQPP